MNYHYELSFFRTPNSHPTPLAYRLFYNTISLICPIKDVGQIYFYKGSVHG